MCSQTHTPTFTMSYRTPFLHLNLPLYLQVKLKVVLFQPLYQCLHHCYFSARNFCLCSSIEMCDFSFVNSWLGTEKIVTYVIDDIIILLSYKWNAQYSTSLILCFLAIWTSHIPLHRFCLHANSCHCVCSTVRNDDKIKIKTKNKHSSRTMPLTSQNQKQERELSAKKFSNDGLRSGFSLPEKLFYLFFFIEWKLFGNLISICFDLHELEVTESMLLSFSLYLFLLFGSCDK